MRPRTSSAAVPRRVGHRRDRRGRGLRGPLAPADVPVSRSRDQQFDELVLDARDAVERRWAKELADVDFAVVAVPDPVDAQRSLDLHGELPLGTVVPPRRGRRAVVVVFRRPIELRAREREARAELVHEVVVEQVAALLGLEPRTVDPAYGDED